MFSYLLRGRGVNKEKKTKCMALITTPATYSIYIKYMENVPTL